MPEIRRKGIHKKVSINLIGYFSNEFKSAISENDIGIDNLSELLLP